MCMAVYGRIWVYMVVYIVVYSCIWLYMIVYGCIWQYMAVYGCVWLYMAVYSCIWLYMAVYGFGGVVGLAYKPTLFEYIGSVLVRASARAICTHGYFVKKP